MFSCDEELLGFLLQLGGRWALTAAASPVPTAAAIWVVS